MILSCSPSAPSSSKKSKDKSISRSQSQRPAGDRDRDLLRAEAIASKAAKDKAEIKDDTGLNQASLSDDKTQLKPITETTATNTQNIASGTSGVCEDVSPSGGSSATLQPGACDKQEIAQAGGDSNPEESKSAPLTQEDGQTESYETDGVQSRLEMVEAAQSKEFSERAPEGNNKSESIYW